MSKPLEQRNNKEKNAQKIARQVNAEVAATTTRQLSKTNHDKLIIQPYQIIFDS